MPLVLLYISIVSSNFGLPFSSKTNSNRAECNKNSIGQLISLLSFHFHIFLNFFAINSIQGRVLVVLNAMESDGLIFIDITFIFPYSQC